MAFRNADAAQNLSYRQAAPAKQFVKENSKFIGEARRSTVGLGHTRRASPGMPIDNSNAHPFDFYKYFYAHNGRINNWQEVKEAMIMHYSSDLAAAESTQDQQKIKDATYYLNYAKKCTTDSMVLGPYIDARDFSVIVGCMALVWLIGNKLYTFRYAKEALAATVVWKHKKNNDGGPRVVTLVGSTKEILSKSLEKTDNLEYEVAYFEFPEDQVFCVEESGLVNEGKVPVNQIAPVDAFSSEAVADTCSAPPFAA